MARLVWDAVGKHMYNTGVDRGVLWVGSFDSSTGTTTWSNGVAFDGLRSVDANPDGADEQAFYADNIKYLSLRGVENFGGSIGCYYTPEEFDACDGTAALTPGVKIGQQVRKAFCFTYRTLVGNELVGNDLGYDIHIVYNATVSPSSRSNQTVNESPEPLELSYDFTTNPIAVNIASTNYRPVSHIIVSSPDIVTFSAPAQKTAYEEDFVLFENYIYGCDEDTEHSITARDSKILLPDQIHTLFTTHAYPV